MKYRAAVLVVATLSGCGGGEIAQQTDASSTVATRDVQEADLQEEEVQEGDVPASDPKLLQTLTGHTGEVNSVTYSPDGQRIVSGGDGVKIWDAKDR